MPERDYETVIGLEVHAELKTKSKVFCPSEAHFGAEPNSHVCPVCLGLPGVLPVLNQKVVEYAVKAALAFNCRVAAFSKFDRKNYYYPDLPKNYQISQYDLPLASGGFLNIEVDGVTKRVGITRVHIEEDAGKLMHQTVDGEEMSLVDYNRTGVPLIEIVSEPDLRSPEEARAYLNKLKAILEYTGVSDCRMEEGSLRCDANISVRAPGARELGTKTEIKNMNSFRALVRALEYEGERQEAVLAEGGRVAQETRAWDEARGITVAMRSKEATHDYRYFPEPDLPPLILDPEWVTGIAAGLPELPDARKERLIRTYGLPAYDAGVITGSKDLADFFDRCLERYQDAKTVSNWLMGDLSRLLNAKGLEPQDSRVTPEQLVDLLQLIDQGRISGRMAKEVFEEMFASGREAQAIIRERNWEQVSDAGVLEEVARRVMAANPNPVADFRQGKEKAMGFLVGQVMKETRGQANPGLVNEILRRLLGEAGA